MTPTWRTGYTLHRQEDSRPTAVTTMALIAAGPTKVLLFSFTENRSNKQAKFCLLTAPYPPPSLYSLLSLKFKEDLSFSGLLFLHLASSKCSLSSITFIEVTF